MNKNYSYIFGLLITDGSLSLNTRNRGKVVLEISKRDEDIVDKLVKYIPNSYKKFRTRITNFSNSKPVDFVSFCNHYKWFRDYLIENGYPLKDKSITANIPNKKYDECSFWRGIIDGDGSVGITNYKNIPFISLTTKSESLKCEYLKFLYNNFNIIRNINRNKRDNI